VVALAGAQYGCRSGAPSTMLPTRRHVLLLTVDTLRADYLSANGYPLPTSPFLDSLCGGATTFARAMTTVPRTTPALASLLTGTYPQTNGVRTLVDRLDARIASLPELARARGYATVAVVSNHILVPQRGLDRGFDVYDAADDARDAAGTTAAALQHLRRYRPADPVFAWVHYIDPHVPYYPPPALAEAFDSGYAGRYRLHFGSEKGGIGDSAYPKCLGKADAVYRNTLPDDVNAHVRRLYAADIRNTDDHIAELVHGLRAALGDDWLIVFSADHGESLGENGYFFDHGDYVSGAELHVPLAFALPVTDPLHGSRTVTDWVSLIDVMPTLVELLDLSLPPGTRVDGRSLVPMLRGDSLPARPVFAECGESFFPGLVHERVHFDIDGRFRTVIFGTKKLIWTPGQEPDRAYQLYDLSSDPSETADLYRSQAASPDVVQLRALLEDWYRRGSRDEASHPISEADHERLRALGYAN
jgi:arylsulfatase